MGEQNLLLIAALAATFVFGYFLAKKLDEDMEENCREQGDDTERSLCTDHSDPMGAETAEIQKQAAGETEHVEKRNVSCYNECANHTGVRKSHGTTKTETGTSFTGNPH